MTLLDDPPIAEPNGFAAGMAGTGFFIQQKSLIGIFLTYGVLMGIGCGGLPSGGSISGLRMRRIDFAVISLAWKRLVIRGQ